MSTAPELEEMVLGPEHAGISMTPEEFDAIDEYDEDYCYELIRGVLVVSPYPLQAERDPNEELGYLLRSYKENHPKGSALDATLPEEYLRTRGNRRRADRAIWAGLGKQPDPINDFPTIVVEFVSAGKRSWRRDYIEKRDEYLEIEAIKEYWVFDRFGRILTVFRRGSEGIIEQIVKEDETYRTSLLPGFEMPVGRILASSDRWKS